MSNFDNILKRGKGAVKEQTMSKDEEFKKCLAAILYYMQYANEMYDDKHDHNLQIDPINCKKCNKASFIITVADLDGGETIVSYNQGTWCSVEQGVYHCPSCKDE